MNKRRMVVAGILLALSGLARAGDDVAFERAWEDLGSGDRETVKSAEEVLQKGGEAAAKFLTEKLVAGPDRAVVAKLVGELGSEDFKTRENATKGLVAMGKKLELLLPTVEEDGETKTRVAFIRGELQKAGAAPVQEAVREELAVGVIARIAPGSGMLGRIVKESPWYGTRMVAQEAESHFYFLEGQRLFDLADAAARRGEDAKKELKEVNFYLGQRSFYGAEVRAYRMARLGAILKGKVAATAMEKELAARPESADLRESLLHAKLSMGDLAGSAALVSEKTPAELREGLKLVGKKELSFEERIKLAAWCKAQAKAAGPGSEKELLMRAREEYQRCLDGEGHSPALLQGEIEGLDEQIADLGMVDAGWTNALTLMDVDKHVMRGEWRKMGTMLQVSPGEFSMVSLPVVPKGSYELEVSLKRTVGEEGIFISVPVGDRRGNLNIGGWTNTATGFERIEGVDAVSSEDANLGRKTGIVNGEVYVYKVRVMLDKDGKTATVTATENGKPLATWKGEIEKLSTHEDWKMGTPNNLALGAHESEVMFQSVRLKMIEGKVDVDRMMRVEKETEPVVVPVPEEVKPLENGGSELE